MRLLFDFANFKLAQIIIFGSMLVGISYFTWFDNGKGLQSNIDSARTSITQVSSQIKAKEKELEEIKAFEREIANQEEVVKKLLIYIPEILTFTDISALLIKEAKSSGVNIEDKQDELVQKEEGSDYRILNTKLKVSGAFSHVLSFLSKLTIQKRMLVVDRIEMNMDRENQSIKASMNVSAYRYEKQKEEKQEVSQ